MIKKLYNRFSFLFLLALTFLCCSSDSTSTSAANRLSAPQSPAVTSSSCDRVTVKWQKVTGAAGYKIYRAAGKSGNYKCIKTVKGKTRYTDTTVNFSTRYSYKVKAYTKLHGRSIESKSSAEKSIKTKKLEAPNVYDSDDKNVMFYVQIPKNTSYEVYRDKNQDKYEFIGEYNAEKFFDETMPYNIDCYYKFRTKKIVGGKTYYSKYSLVSSYYREKKSTTPADDMKSDTNSTTTNSNTTTSDNQNDYEAPSDEMSNQILELLNTDRIAQGLQPLTMNKGLTLAAEIRARELQIAYQHPRPQGGTKVELAKSCGFLVTDYISENIMMNSRTAEEFYTAWYNSPEHHDAMFSPRATKVGIAIYQDENGVLYGVQLFSN